jgi:hypothetical protein
MWAVSMVLIASLRAKKASWRPLGEIITWSVWGTVTAVPSDMRMMKGWEPADSMFCLSKGWAHRSRSLHFASGHEERNLSVAEVFFVR